MSLPAEEQHRRTVRRCFAALLLLGVLACAAAAIFTPLRLWANLLSVTFLASSLGMGGLLFLALHSVSGARWHEPLRRPAEGMGNTVPVAAVLLALTVVGGIGYYPWMQHRPEEPATFWFKAMWLEPTFFVARTCVYVVAWAIAARWVVRSSRRCAFEPSAGTRRRHARASAGFLVLFALSFWPATTDWLMSLEPHWYSTIFAAYHFAGALLGGLALLVLLAVWLRENSASSAISENTLHDLGKLLFGFSSFWMYLWFSQYVLIWYTNIPEEAVYVVRRWSGLWGPLSLASLCLNWVVPFFVLLPRASKRNATILFRVAVIVLIGRWLDLYLGILPPIVGAQPVLGFAEVGTLLLGVGGFSWYLKEALRRTDPAQHGGPSHVRSEGALGGKDNSPMGSARETSADVVRASNA